jgi:alpha-amylase
VPLRFVFALHNHQPVGNFGHVFENAYRDAYAPFLDLIEQYPEIPVSLHTSGPLLEWLTTQRPEHVDRLRRLVARGQVEILGGAFYEPILPMIPSRDRVGQIASYKAYLENLFQTRIRGMWIPERVWEQSLVSDIAAAGIEYTVLDDYHFRQAGLEEDHLFGYYLTEDEGRLLHVFPGSERMRYLIPFRNPEESIHYFGELTGRHPDAVVVFADDGEKLGSWPETHKHCYTDGWLRRFLDCLRGARSWVRLCTFAQALDETPPVGRIFLPDASYREMTEWALPPSRLADLRQLAREMEHDPRWSRLQRFVRGGYWRNFKARYPETQEMYARMLEVSKRIAGAKTEQEGKDAGAETSPPGTQHSALSTQHSALPLTDARRHLYQAQCNCPWWHGTFGGLYLPHLRNAVYHHLIAAENAFLAAERRGSWVEAETADFNLDGKPEVCLRNDRLAAYFQPAAGGGLYELDVRPIRHNLLATLSRRPEVYHDAIRRHAPGQHGERFLAKQTGLDRLLQYDPYLRKSFLDHFYEPGLTLDRLAACQETELGDFVTGLYEQSVQRDDDEIRLTLRRSGQAAGHSVRLTKEVRLRSGSDVLEARYVLENLPREPRLRFAVECNFAGMAAGAEDRYFHVEGWRLGQLQTLQDLTDADRLALVDEWLGLEATLSWSRRGGVWAFPIQTVSQSEGGYELVHQSTAVVPHWLVEPDASGRWEIALSLRLDTSRETVTKRG